jgi:Tol biopolymer transport system component
MSEPARRCAILIAIASLSLAQLSCGAAGESAPTVVPPIVVPTTGSLVIMLQPLGNGRDADGFSAMIDGASTRTLTSDASVAYDSLSPGNHTVRIAGIAPHCSASADSVTHAVKVGATDTVTVGMTCLGGFAYLQDRDAISTDIGYLTEDGRTIQLTNGPGLKFIEAWSPDGTRLLFSQEQTNGWRIHSVRADGTDSRPLTSDVANEFSPQWSPDGVHIAYTKGDPTAGAIYIAISDADGGNVHPLAGMSTLDFDVTWSADGSRLYFACDRFQRSHDICTAAVDGSDLRPIRYAALDSILTPCTPACMASVRYLAASPDGSTIAIEVASGRGTVLQRVWAASVDGTSAISLSGNTVSFEGRWSPSGDRMLLTGNGLATVNRDGTGYRLVTNSDDDLQSGDWSPDGAVIAYGDARAGQIGAMNADGSARRLLTTGSYKYTPVWNPKARSVGSLSADRARASLPHLEPLPILSRLRPEVLRRMRFREPVRG